MRDEKCEGDIERRVKAGGALHSVLSSKIISSKDRLAVIQSVFTPTLMYL